MRTPPLLCLAVLAASPSLFAQTATWNNPAGGLWDVPTNWAPAGVPNGAGAFPDIGLAGNYTVELNLDVALDQFRLSAPDATFLMQGRTVTMTGAGNLLPGNTSQLDFRSSTWTGSGQLRNQARIEVRGGSRFDNLLQDGVLDIVGSPTNGNAILTLNNPTVNNGTIQLDAVSGAWSSTLSLPGASQLDNFGTFESKAGTGGPRTVSGHFLNHATTTIGQALNMNTGPVEQLAGSFSILFPHSLTLGNGTDFLMQGGTLDVLGTMNMASALFDFSGGDVNGIPRLKSSQLDIAPTAGVGLFELTGGSSLNGNLSAAQEIRIIGSPSAGNAITTLALTTVNDGTIRMSSESGAWGSTLTMGSGLSLTNRNLIEVEAATGGSRIFTGSLINEGSLHLAQDTSLNRGPFVNHGSWLIDSGVTATLGTGTTFTLESGTVDLQGNWSHASGPFQLNGGSFTGIPELKSDTLSFGPGFNTAFTPKLIGGSTLSSDVPAGSSLAVTGSPNGGNAILSPSLDVSLHGQMDLSSESGAWSSSWAGGSHLLSNFGTLRSLVGSGGPRSFAGALDNQGSISLEAVSTTFNGGDIDQQGSLTVAPGAAMSMTGSVAFNQRSGTLNIDGSLSKDGGNARFLGGSVNGLVELKSLTLEFDPLAFTAPASLLLRGGSTLLSDLPAATTLTLRGSPAGGNQVLTLPASTTLAGTTVLDTEGGAWSSTLTSPSGNLTTNSGTIRVEAGTGGSRSIKGDVVNLGTMELQSATSYNSGSLNNQGLLSIPSGGSLDITNGSFIQQAGSLDIQGSFSQSGGSTTFLGGSINGQAELKSVALSFDPAFLSPIQLLGRGGISFSGATVFGQEIHLLGSPSGGNLVFTAAAGLDLGGLIILGTEGGAWGATVTTAGAPLSITDSGRLRVENATGGPRTVTADLSNAGTVAVLGTTCLFNGPGFSHNLDGGIVRGTGTVDLNGGTLQNDGILEPGDGTGTLTLKGDLIDGPTAVMDVQIGGLNAGLDYDVLDVIGNATVDGEISILLENGFQPSFGDQFTIMTATSISGTFDRARLRGGGSLPAGIGFDVIHNPTSIVVQVVSKRQDLASNKQLVPVTLSPPIPGIAGQQNTLQANGITGYGQADLAFGLATGITPIAGCSLDWGIASVTVLGSANASAQGRALFQVVVPGAAAGTTAYFQALDVSGCRLSEVRAVTFP